MANTKPPSKLCVTRTTGGCLASDKHGHKACWSVYFEHLNTFDPPNGQLPNAISHVVDVDPPTNKTAPTPE